MVLNEKVRSVPKLERQVTSSRRPYLVPPFKREFHAAATTFNAVLKILLGVTVANKKDIKKFGVYVLVGSFTSCCDIHWTENLSRWLETSFHKFSVSNMKSDNLVSYRGANIKKKNKCCQNGKRKKSRSRLGYKNLFSYNTTCSSTWLI